MNEAAFWEHQASFNPNMPVRFLIYAAHVYDKYMTTHDLYRYGVILKKLPKPKCICFYNGTDDQPEEQELRLSDAFGGTDGDIEVRVRMLNVNYGHSCDLMKSCSLLREYAWFIETVRQNQKRIKDLDAAIDAALDEMPDDFELKKFLRAHKAEVKGMYLTEYDEEKERRLAREEAAMIGREEGRVEGADAEKKRVAAEMLKERMPMSLIGKISALSEQAIMEIARSLGIEAV